MLFQILRDFYNFKIINTSQLFWTLMTFVIKQAIFFDLGLKRYFLKCMAYILSTLY